MDRLTLLGVVSFLCCLRSSGALRLAANGEQELHLGSGGAQRKGGTQPTTAPSSSEDYIHVLLSGDRACALATTINSLVKNSKSPGRMWLWIIAEVGSEQADEAPLGEAAAQFGVAKMTLLTTAAIERDLQNSGLSPVWTWPGFGASESWATFPQRDGVGLEEPKWDKDTKHHSPYNLLRFYLADLSYFKNVSQLVLLDDDLVIQGDLLDLLASPTRPSTAVQSTCDTWSFQTKSKGVMKFTLNERRLAVSPAAKRLQPKASLLGVDWAKAEQEVDWNFGVARLNLAVWRAEGITKAYEDLVRRNAELRLVRETSLVYGLGLPQLALVGHHECLPPDQPSLRVVEGLGFLTDDDLKRSIPDVPAYLRDALALHYAGAKKPWLPESELSDDLRARWTKYRPSRVCDESSSGANLIAALNHHVAE